MWFTACFENHFRGSFTTKIGNENNYNKIFVLSQNFDKYDYKSSVFLVFLSLKVFVC